MRARAGGRPMAASCRRFAERRLAAGLWFVPALVVAGFCLVWPSGATAQVVLNHAALDPGRPNVVHVRTGFDYGLIAEVGYSRALGLGSRTLLLSGQVTTPWAGADAEDYAARVGGTIDIVGRDRWRLLGGLGGTVQGTRNTLARMTSLGADGVLLGGYWSPGWFVAAEGGYEGAIATHVRHTDRYREVHYADARDGWYLDTAGNIRVGVAAGLSLGVYDLVVRAGQVRDREGHTHLLPAYASFAVNRRF